MDTFDFLELILKDRVIRDLISNKISRSLATQTIKEGIEERLKDEEESQRECIKDILEWKSPFDDKPYYGYFKNRDRNKLSNKYRYALLYYKGVPEEKWIECIPKWDEWDNSHKGLPFPSFPEVFVQNQNKLEFGHNLVGMWRVYVKTSEGVYLTFAKFGKDLRGQYNSITGGISMNMELFPESSHRFNLKCKGTIDRDVLIRARLDNSMLRNSEISFPAIVTANQGRKFFGDMMIWWKPEKGKHSSLSLYPSFRDCPRAKIIATSKDSFESDIITFLSHQKGLHTPYLPTRSLKDLNIDFLRKQGRLGYDTLKARFHGHNWISISRIPNSHINLGIYKWEFEFDDTMKRCFVKRFSRYKNGHTEYEGEARTFNNRLWIHFYGAKHTNRHKILYAQERDINNDDLIVLALGSSIYGDERESHMVKEIIIKEDILNDYESKVSELENGNGLPYKVYLKLNIPFQYKIQLAYRPNSILKYDNANDERTKTNRQEKASSYAGDYYVYFPNRYSTKERKLFRSTLTIDELAVPSLIKRYEDKNIPDVHYHGEPGEIINKTLRLVLEHEPIDDGSSTNRAEGKRQYCETRIIVEDNQRALYVGLLSDTDLQRLPDSFGCMIIKKTTMGSVLKGYSPEVISFTESLEIKQLWNVLEYEYSGEFERNFGKKLAILDQDESINPVKSIEHFFVTVGGVYFHNYKRPYF